MFVPNRIPNLFTRRPEMIRPLPAKIDTIQGGMGHAKPSGRSVRHFVFFLHRQGGRHFWIRRCPRRQPNNEPTQEGFGDFPEEDSTLVFLSDSKYALMPRKLKFETSSFIREITNTMASQSSIAK